MQDGNTSGEDGNDIDWNTEDELEIDNFTLSSSSSLTVPGGEAVVGCGEVNVFASVFLKYNIYLMNILMGYLIYIT